MNRAFKNSHNHQRFVEFKESKFYSTDFVSSHLKFLNVYDMNENLVGEFAHFTEAAKKINKWITPDNNVLSCGELIVNLVDLCKSNDGVFLDAYIDDIFKPNPTLTAKRIFRYKMTMGKTLRGKRGALYSGGIECLYNLEAVGDVGTFHSFEQLLIEH